MQQKNIDYEAVSGMLANRQNQLIKKFWIVYCKSIKLLLVFFPPAFFPYKFFHKQTIASPLTHQPYEYETTQDHEINY